MFHTCAMDVGSESFRVALCVCPYRWGGRHSYPLCTLWGERYMYTHYLSFPGCGLSYMYVVPLCVLSTVHLLIREEIENVTVDMPTFGSHTHLITWLIDHTQMHGTSKCICISNPTLSTVTHYLLLFFNLRWVDDWQLFPSQNRLLSRHTGTGPTNQPCNLFTDSLALTVNIITPQQVSCNYYTCILILYMHDAYTCTCICPFWTYHKE